MKYKNAIYFLIVLVVVAGLVYITINSKNKMPEEQIVKARDIVSVNYTGSLEGGTAFDSNVDPKFGHAGQPLIFTVGAGQMIPGFDKGVLGMKVGEKKTLTLPPEEAYGADGRPPVIPPNSTLVFEIELLAIKE
jgi:FKBP-type peptidyl-prolyl cis-trans isomerase